MFLKSAIQQFRDYKGLADKTFAQLDEADFHYRPNEVSNSLAIIITHMHGNMLSRWTNFLTEDGEKEWRKRDNEFEEQQLTKQQLLTLWEEGWNVLFDALQQLKVEDLNSTIHIRTKPLSVIDGILRQLTHHASHVGQIIFAGKIIAGNNWRSLSIGKNESKLFNEQMKNS
ncbi:DUF1572 family protein [Niabella ginsengisoli]|uniref:DUF1572 domain-containing protein n=1 Tax=Niabella ginsengisoli TaxID=522298 RepID=A0ABS9SL82_9BACT|nr:DUF1572 family protein [Niabella ginsengisoli]MCH5599144.1 DUF1572 domain-containing protein [Niabella ginsengisoli]